MSASYLTYQPIFADSNPTLSPRRHRACPLRAAARSATFSRWRACRSCTRASPRGASSSASPRRRSFNPPPPPSSASSRTAASPSVLHASPPLASLAHSL
eukprot:1160853-Pleurochrysis_carterae.AAC.2